MKKVITQVKPTIGLPLEIVNENGYTLSAAVTKIQPSEVWKNAWACWLEDGSVMIALYAERID